MTIKEIWDALKNFEISYEKALIEIDTMYDKIDIALKKVSAPDPKIEIAPDEILLYPNGITLNDYWQHPLSPIIRRDFAEYLKEAGYDLDDIVELLSAKETIEQIIAQKHHATIAIKEISKPTAGQEPERGRGMKVTEIKQALYRGELSPEKALGEIKATLLEIEDAAKNSMVNAYLSGEEAANFPATIEEYWANRKNKHIADPFEKSLLLTKYNPINGYSIEGLKTLETEIETQILFGNEDEKRFNRDAVEKRFAERKFLSDTEIRLKLEREEITGEQALLEQRASYFGIERMIFDSVPMRVWNDETVWNYDMIEKYGYQKLIIERTRLQELHALTTAYLETKRKIEKKERRKTPSGTQESKAGPTTTAAAPEPLKATIAQITLGLERGHLRDNGDDTFTVQTSLSLYFEMLKAEKLPRKFSMFDKVLTKEDGKPYTTKTLKKEIQNIGL